MRFDRKTFFDGYRKAFGPIQGQLQVDGLNFLLAKIESDSLSLEQSAYLLATVKHETADTYQPIKEFRARKGTRLRATQDRYWLSGFYGRGYVMITWEENYRKFGIADEPDKALEPDTAYEILSRGMREGKFTKYKLSDFVNGDVDYINARKVVNGLDKANLIAGYAQKFERILRVALVKESEPFAKSLVEEKEAEAAPEEAKPEVSQINVEHADEVSATPQPLPGAAKDDEPIQASQGGKKSLIASVVGVAGGAGTAIGGWLQNSAALKIVGVFCVTIVLLALIFRQVIMDYIRMKYISDPARINVR